jgi:hypothetical protein
VHGEKVTLEHDHVRPLLVALEVIVVGEFDGETLRLA